eukprot:jgi/Orpsp1_1/1192889/evm.model.d7180000096715.1
MLSNSIQINSKTNLNDNSNKLTSSNVNQFSPSIQCNYSNQLKNNSNSSFSSKLKVLNTPINVCYIGAGYVGGTSSAVMAYKCPCNMVNVTVCDVDIDKINSWNSDKLPIYEPGLENIVQKQRGKNLFYTTDLDNAINTADIIFISVGTPTKQRGFGAGEAAELKYVESAARKIAQVSKNSKIIVEKSTVPCRTAEHIRTILNANKISSSNIPYDINYNLKYDTNSNINNTHNYNSNIFINSTYSINNECSISNDLIKNNNNNNNNSTSNSMNLVNETYSTNDYNNLMDSLSLSNNDSTLTDIDSC